jgi:hypothetical protein
MMHMSNNDVETKSMSPEEIEDYKQLCEDWRYRDKFGWERFPVVLVIVSSLIAISTYVLKNNHRYMSLVLMWLATYFAFIYLVSLIRNIMFLKGTEEQIIKIMGENPRMRIPKDLGLFKYIKPFSTTKLATFGISLLFIILFCYSIFSTVSVFN